jgi:hypothetical protein
MDNIKDNAMMIKALARLAGNYARSIYGENLTVILLLDTVNDIQALADEIVKSVDCPIDPNKSYREGTD